MYLSTNMFFALQWIIELPLKGENLKEDTGERIIIPALTKAILAASQDVVGSPDEVSLIKNLQVWTFEAVRESDHVYE